MNSKGHLQINKYFAFVFMVFAVISGVNDNYAEAALLASQGNELPYFVRANHLLSKDITRIKAKSQEEKHDAFSSFIHDAYAAAGTMDYAGISLAFGVFVIAILSLNNKINQNNIWRATVF